MNRSARIALAFTICTVMGTALASAQTSRSWVSGTGDDENPCSRTAPCKTFAAALAVTAVGGEISALDPGGFGAVTIGQSVTLDCDGTLASVLSLTGNGITVDGAGVVVTLRNISVMCTNGLCAKGVELRNGAALILDHVTISGFETGVSTSAGNTMVINSTIVRNSGYGVRALVGILTVEGSTLAHNGVGARADTGATVNLANNGVYSNLTGFGCGGGTLASDGKNRKGNNTGGLVDTCAPTGVIPLK